MTPDIDLKSTAGLVLDGIPIRAIPELEIELLIFHADAFGLEQENAARHLRPRLIGFAEGRYQVSSCRQRHSLHHLIL